jgi:hypothetical protein
VRRVIIYASFVSQSEPLGNAKAVLFIDDDQSELVVRHVILKQGMSANRNPGLAVSQPGASFPTITLT